MKHERAVSAPPRAPDVRSLHTLDVTARSHRETVRRIRERRRQRRLRWVLYANSLLFLYFANRAIKERPLVLRVPDLGPDAIFYLMPVLLVLGLAGMMLLPLLQGRSPAIRYSPGELSTTFNDVRGADVVLEEVGRTLQIFLAYKSFREELGGNPRRGLLFEGPPGTGKTHMAKAMASEAGVPFFFVSAPAFQSMWFGMTAYKIRSFFKQLRKAARTYGGAIGFIEEIDAIASSRDGVGSPNVHRMASTTGSGSMVNELLIQMQSFDAPPRGAKIVGALKDLLNLFLRAERHLRKSAVPYHNVLVIGATNLAGALDPALLRPGRFDRILHFDLPSLAGRRDLLDYFLTRRAHEAELDDDIVRDELASMAIGYSPAKLEHLLDEALVWAVRDGRHAMTFADIMRARMSEEIGLAQPVAYTEHERRVIATHEAGHAVAAYFVAPRRRLEVLSVLKRASALGLLAHSDTEERFTRAKSELRATMLISLAGLACEEIFFGEHGTGPASDLHTATTLAAQMVGAFGMGRSLISYDAAGTGPNIVARVLTNEDARAEVAELLEHAKRDIGRLLITNRHVVEALRDALLDREELLGDEILDVIERARRVHARQARPGQTSEPA